MLILANYIVKRYNIVDINMIYKLYNLDDMIDIINLIIFFIS